MVYSSETLGILTAPKRPPEMAQNGAKTDPKWARERPQNRALSEGRKAPKRFVPLMFWLEMAPEGPPEREQNGPKMSPKWAKICA